MMRISFSPTALRDLMVIANGLPMADNAYPSHRSTIPLSVRSAVADIPATVPATRAARLL